MYRTINKFQNQVVGLSERLSVSELAGRSESGLLSIPEESGLEVAGPESGMSDSRRPGALSHWHRLLRIGSQSPV